MPTLVITHVTGEGIILSIAGDSYLNLNEKLFPGRLGTSLLPFALRQPYFKGTSRGPEALQSHLNDSYYTNVLCWQ